MKIAPLFICLLYKIYLIVLQVVFPKNTSESSNSKMKEMVSLESFLMKITTHMIEKCVYTRAIESPDIHMQEIPPLIAPALRAPVVVNLEGEKQSAFLKRDEVPEGTV